MTWKVDYNKYPHPNALKARMRPEAVRLSTDKDAVLERRKRAAELRRSGMTYREIGKELGVSSARARQIVLRAERMGL